MCNDNLLYVRSFATSLLVATILFTHAVMAADNRPVIQVQRIDVHGNVPLYVEMVRHVIERQNKVVPGLQTKVYRADFAGEEAGYVYVLVEFPSLEEMGKAIALLGNDKEWVELVQAVEEKTDRKILSRMILTDVTPPVSD